MMEKIKNEAALAAAQLIEKANLKPGQTVVIGCSSSEVTGGTIGKIPLWKLHRRFSAGCIRCSRKKEYILPPSAVSI